MVLTDENPRPPPARSGAPARGQRRVAHRVPARTPQWVVIQVLRDALDPAWRPTAAARRLTDAVQDPQVLRLARARLLREARERAGASQGRAVATLNMAIKRLERRHPGTVPDDGAADE